MQFQSTGMRSNHRLRFKDARGFTIIQIVITVAVIAIFTSFALITLTSARSYLHLQNSVRQLAGYLEKARLDAVRRHANPNSTVVFTSPTTYDVTMDFSGSGTLITRTFTFENGVSIVSTPLPTLSFNWRGRTSACTTTFTVQNSRGEQSWVDVSDAGDVTVNSNVDVLPNANFATVNNNSDVQSNAVVPGSALHDNSVDCSGSSGAPGPPITGSGPGCSGDSADPSSISIKKNGGGTAQIGVTASSTGTVTVSAPINLQVTPANQTVAGGGTVNFSITSLNNSRGTFAVNFNTPCTTLTVL